MKYGFNKIRFALFSKSYSGYLIAEYIRNLSPDKRKSAIEKLAKVLLVNKRFLNCFIFHKTCKNKFSKVLKDVSKKDEKIRIYLSVEKELIFLTQERKNKIDTLFEDYEYALLEPAFERVAGNSLRNVSNDLEFDRKIIESINIYRRFYYQVAYRSRIPTLRIVPFILRLISL